MVTHVADGLARSDKGCRKKTAIPAVSQAPFERAKPVAGIARARRRRRGGAGSVSMLSRREGKLAEVRPGSCLALPASRPGSRPLPRQSRARPASERLDPGHSPASRVSSLPAVPMPVGCTFRPSLPETRRPPRSPRRPSCACSPGAGQAARGVAPWNCSSSVEPARAVVEDSPCWIVCVTASK
jgi:hypothetical protein